MAETYKRLGAVASATPTLLFANPSSSNWTVISSIIICNTSSSSRTYNISMGSSSSLLTTPNYAISSSAPISANDTVILVLGACLDSACTNLVVSASAADVHIQAFGLVGP